MNNRKIKITGLIVLLKGVTLHQSAKKFQKKCLNVSKCRTMWLGEDECNLLLYLDGKSIEMCHSMKLLGVTIDSDLNFYEHKSELICMSVSNCKC